MVYEGVRGDDVQRGKEDEVVREGLEASVVAGTSKCGLQNYYIKNENKLKKGLNIRVP